MAQINIRVSDEERKRLADQAAATGITISDIIRNALHEHEQRATLSQLAEQITALETRMAERIQRIPAAAGVATMDELDRRKAAAIAAQQQRGQESRSKGVRHE